MVHHDSKTAILYQVTNCYNHEGLQHRACGVCKTLQLQAHVIIVEGVSAICSMRMQRVEKLKAAKAGTGPSTSSQQDDELAAEVALDPDIIPVGPAKKRRMLNLSEVLEPSLDAEGEDDEEDDDLVLDWRAKTF